MSRLRPSDLVTENRVISMVEAFLVYWGDSCVTTDQYCMPSSSSMSKRATYSGVEAYNLAKGRGRSSVAVLMSVKIAVWKGLVFL